MTHRISNFNTHHSWFTVFISATTHEIFYRRRTKHTFSSWWTAESYGHAKTQKLLSRVSDQTRSSNLRDWKYAPVCPQTLTLHSAYCITVNRRWVHSAFHANTQWLRLSWTSTSQPFTWKGTNGKGKHSYFKVAVICISKKISKCSTTRILHERTREHLRCSATMHWKCSQAGRQREILFDWH